MDNLPLLTIGVTLLACVLCVVGVHAYSSGRAQRQALVERMSQTSPLALPPAGDGGSAVSTDGCAGHGSATASSGRSRLRAST